MVRVVSQNFSHPRSRHSSGETDLDLALRADSALSTLRAKRTDLADCESSSDSFWDSEIDTDQQDQQMGPQSCTEDEINGNGGSEKSVVQTKRKERRRERNKVSAQAYRQRCRQVNVSTQQELTLLEERNKHLLKQVHDLETKTEQAKQFLKGQRVTVPDFLIPSKTKKPEISTPSSFNISPEPQNPSVTDSPNCLSKNSPSLSTNVNINSHHDWAFGKFAKHNFGSSSPVNANLAPASPVNLNSLGASACPVNLNSLCASASPVNLNSLGASASPVNLNSLSASASPVNLNSLGASANMTPPLSPIETLSPGSDLPVVKPKHHLFNANHYYKVPIHQAKVLHTVHEIPSNTTVREDHSPPTSCLLTPSSPLFCNNNTTELNTDGGQVGCDESATQSHSRGFHLLNMNERPHSNSTNLNTIKEDKIWNGAYHNNTSGNMNDNDNTAAPISNAHLQTTSPHLLLHPNSFVQLIISTGENNKMPSQ